MDSGINYQMLKNWQSAAEHFASDHPAFVALDTHVLPDHSTSASCFTLTYACGETLQVNGQFSLAQLTALAQGLSQPDHAVIGVQRTDRSVAPVIDLNN
jgi:hypothetical protein